MRSVVFVSLVLLCRVVCGQDIVVQDAPANLGQAIGVGAVNVVADYEARIKVLEGMVGSYTPTWTWPGSAGPEPFEALRKHMAGDAIHPERDVSKWTKTELAYIHDREHVQELLDAGKGLPFLKDQRLRDWARSKSPAKALPRKLGWTVKRIVMHTQPNCPPCDRWKQDNLAAVQADGVEFVEAPPDHRNTPAFDVQFCDGDQCRTLLFGNMRYSTMKRALDQDDFIPAPAGD